MPCGNLGSVSKTCSGQCNCCRKTTRLVSTEDAAQYLGVSRTKIRSLIHDGTLRRVSGITKSFKLDVNDLDALILRSKNLKYYAIVGSVISGLLFGDALLYA
jgi:excisionase family DNA binding protein